MLYDILKNEFQSIICLKIIFFNFYLRNRGFVLLLKNIDCVSSFLIIFVFELLNYCIIASVLFYFISIFVFIKWFQILVN